MIHHGNRNDCQGWLRITYVLLFLCSALYRLFRWTSPAQLFLPQPWRVSFVTAGCWSVSAWKACSFLITSLSESMHFFYSGNKSPVANRKRRVEDSLTTRTASWLWHWSSCVVHNDRSANPPQCKLNSMYCPSPTTTFICCYGSYCTSG